MTSELHVMFWFLPVSFLIISTLIVLFANMRTDMKLLKIGLYANFLSSFVIVAVGALGGASMMWIRTQNNINNTMVDNHTFSALMVVVIAIVLFFMSLRSLRLINKGTPNKLINFGIIALSIISICILFISTEMAEDIRLPR